MLFLVLQFFIFLILYKYIYTTSDHINISSPEEDNSTFSEYITEARGMSSFTEWTLRFTFIHFITPILAIDFLVRPHSPIGLHLFLYISRISIIYLNMQCIDRPYKYHETDSSFYLGYNYIIFLSWKFFTVVFFLLLLQLLRTAPFYTMKLFSWHFFFHFTFFFITLILFYGSTSSSALLAL